MWPCSTELFSSVSASMSSLLVKQMSWLCRQTSWTAHTDAVTQIKHLGPKGKRLHTKNTSSVKRGRIYYLLIVLHFHMAGGGISFLFAITPFFKVKPMIKHNTGKYCCIYCRLPSLVEVLHVSFSSIVTQVWWIIHVFVTRVNLTRCTIISDFLSQGYLCQLFPGWLWCNIKMQSWL